jgi:hypothetical protein
MNRSPSEVAFAPDREEAQAMQRDPLVVRCFSLRYLLAQRKVMNRCPQNMAAVEAPLLGAAQVSDKRKLVAPEGGHGSSAVETMVQPLVAWFTAHTTP